MAAYSLKNRIVTSLVNISNILRGIELRIPLNNLQSRTLSQEVKYSLFGSSACHQLLSTQKKRCPQHPWVAAPPPLASSFHSTKTTRGLEEFFDDPKNWGQPNVKAGRAWSKDEMRLKDYVTLHKLWYVLLKEKNLLLTMQAESDRQDKFLPNPERIEKLIKDGEKSRRKIEKE